MRCLHPAPLHHQLGLAVSLAWETLAKNRVADIVRVWVGPGLGDASAGLGLQYQHFLPTHEALFCRRFRRGISEAHFCACWRQALPGMPVMLGPRSTKRCKYRVLGPSGARARDPSHKTLLFTACCLLLRAVLFGLLFLAPLARARDPMSAFWVGARPGPRKLAGVGNMHNLDQPYHSTGYVSHTRNMT